MKRWAHRLILFLLTSHGVDADEYTNFIRQIQQPSNVVWDMSVAATGAQQSALEINPGGATFQLHAVNSSTLAAYLLDTKYVGAYVPIAQISVRSEDPYAAIPRTRAGRPFYVDITVSGLLKGASDPAASKQVTFLHHVQSYGTGGTGAGIDRTQATLIKQEAITSNITANTRTYTYSVVPAANVAKTRGEERFSIFTVQDTRDTYSVAPSQLASQYIQIWPVPDGAIAGIAMNAKIKFSVPPVTFSVRDIYPGSQVYAQAYKGGVSDSPPNPIQVGAAPVAIYATPTDSTFTTNNLGALFESDGQWTVELLSSSPFGLERLSYVSFELDRTIQVKSGVTTGD